MAEGMAGLEPRVARIESDVANLRETATRLDTRLDQVDERFDQIDERLESIDEKVDQRFDKLEGKVIHLGERMSAMEQGFQGMRENQSRLDVDLRELRSSLDRKFVWMVTTMIAFGTALLAAMARGFHWLG